MYKLTILGNERLRQGKKPQQNCVFLYLFRNYQLLQIKNSLKTHFEHKIVFQYFKKSNIGVVIFTNTAGTIIWFSLSNLIFKFV